jgi:hypothetical protein
MSPEDRNTSIVAHRGGRGKPFARPAALSYSLQTTIFLGILRGAKRSNA